jgi:hypothetical protein
MRPKRAKYFGSHVAMTAINVYQIYFDEATKERLDHGFNPLDNTENSRPDWYEFWVIRRFLLAHELQDGAWYGFLSPKFGDKTGLSSAQVMHTLASVPADCDAVLFSPGWDQLAYFLNPFEQGDFWHPGLQAASQHFCDAVGIKVDLENLSTHSGTSVFSNFIVAKASFWCEWLKVANLFFAFAEGPSNDALCASTSYGSPSHLAPMKTFIQERLTSLVLAQGSFNVVPFDFSHHVPVFDRLFPEGDAVRRDLQTCDFLKRRFTQTGKRDFLKAYQALRATISFGSI